MGVDADPLTVASNSNASLDVVLETSSWSPQKVGMWKRKRGVSAGSQCKKYAKKEERISQILALEGLTTREVAQELGVSYEYVRRIRKELEGY